DHDDQVYGVEVSETMGPSLLQVTLGAGKAEAILDHHHGERAFSMTGRWQLDLTPRTALVGSAAYRHSPDLDPKSGLIGAAFGLVPTPRLRLSAPRSGLPPPPPLASGPKGAGSLQTQARGGHSWIAVNETSFEAYRGLWL